MRRSRSLLPVALLSLVCGACAASAEAAAQPWADWDTFAARFVQSDGRVVDITFGGKTTSEGQSYGLFFALVAGRRDQFDTLLDWTSNNLAHGNLGKRLPAWLWGKRNDGAWGVKDENSAADADLWTAYALLEAGRLWNEPRYSQLGQALLELIQRREVVQAGAAGYVLLPAPVGFDFGGGRYRLNPSYLPGFMFRYLAATDPKGPWQSVWDDYVRLAPKIYASGIAPDRYFVDERGDVTADSEAKPSASYDAIRVYLWAGMSQPGPLLGLLTPYSALIARFGMPPENVDPVSGTPLRSSYSPIGFSGAVLPYLSALGQKTMLDAQLERVRDAQRRAKQSGAATNYYDEALILFGKGWLDGQYRFDEQGRLQPIWSR